MKVTLNPPPPKAEWHFEGLTELEQWACYFYEYSRSHETIPGNVLKTREMSPEAQERIHQFNLLWLKGKLIHDREQKGQERFALLVDICPEFPSAAWLAIPSEIRKARLAELPAVENELYRPVKEHELSSIARDPTSETAENYLGLDEPAREFAVVRLDWNLSDTALRKKFDCILNHRPHPEARRKSGGRKNSPMDGLRALSALRLKRHYGSISKVMAAKYQGLVELIYSDERARYRRPPWRPRLGKLRPVVPGELVFILANTGAGKTAALQNTAASLPHLPTLFFELELPGTLTFERFAAIAAQKETRTVWATYKNPGEAVVDWRGSGKLDHVHVCSKSGIKVADIERMVTLAHLKTGKPPAVVMVDYVGLIHGEGKSRYERTSSVAEELKVLAKRTNTVVICASQVSRDKDDPHAEVSIFSGEDSGSIKNSSGLLFGLWRDKERAGPAYLRVLKSTKGGSGLTVACDFQGETIRITVHVFVINPISAAPSRPTATTIHKHAFPHRRNPTGRRLAVHQR